MKTVRSKDGTTIAFDQSGKGPSLILVGGAFEQRAMESETAQLAAFPLLAEHFTVIHYDRRGRGDSTDTQPYAVQREVEDIEALIDAVGGTSFVSGISSGGMLALEAALMLGGKIKKLAIYEPPYISDGSIGPALQKFRVDFAKALAEGRSGDAVAHFLALMGLPAEHLEGMRQFPMWPMWEAIAPTFGYEAALMGEDGSPPIQRAAQLSLPVLVITGEATPYPFMAATALALANAIPGGQYRTLKDQTHEVTAAALAPVLVGFFTG
jgi:pimeloyl-ACP methyl ester carboxylesterase